MSDLQNPEDKAIVPAGRQELVVRSSGLAKRGLESIASQQERVIHFPTDRSMGELWIFDIGVTFECYIPENPEQILGKAQGAIKVPSNKNLVLFVSPKASADLSPLAALKPNDLQGLCFEYPSKISDAGLAYLKGLTSLKKLHLDWTQVSDTGLAYLKELTLLQELHLGHTQVSDTGLAHLKGLTKLQSLYLGDTGVSNNGLTYLEGLTSLRELFLQNTKVTDAGLFHLKGLASLKTLDLDDTEVDGTGLVNLKDLMSLQELYLIRTPITESMLCNIAGWLSGTKIWSMYGIIEPSSRNPR